MYQISLNEVILDLKDTAIQQKRVVSIGEFYTPPSLIGPQDKS